MGYGRLWTVVFAGLALALAAACVGSDPVEFRGSILNPPQRAVEFTLVDQFGDRVSLSDRRGEVVVLTFLYTYCPDICPVVASHLTEVYEQLSADTEIGGAISIVAVSVDPERDTVKRVHEYSSQYGMLQGWTYLVGSEEDLLQTWADYYVSPAHLKADQLEESDPLEPGLLDGDGSADSLVDHLAAAYSVDHQAPVYLIDPEGMIRVLFTLPFSPEDVVADVRTLFQ